LAIDNSRNILYTLSENSIIEVYDLGTDGRSTNKVFTYNTLYSDVARQYTRFRNANFSLIGIAPTLNIESRSIHLIAFTNKGDRFFFSTNEGSNIYRPKFLQFRFAKSIQESSPNRLSPQRQIGGTLQQQNVQEIHEVFYNRGVYILADTRTEESDTLHTMNIEQIPGRTGPNSLIETNGTLDVQGRTYAIAEVCSHFKHN
jgi:hypothetical protein